MSAKETIDARPETIGSLITFSSMPETIVVPVYQRFYQWDASKVIDILRLTDPDSRDFGFIGTMVFVQTKQHGLEVVDGQQRLLSIVLILCAFRDFIKEYVEACSDQDVKSKLDDMARDIQHENLLVSKSYSDAKSKPRILFHRKSYELFNNRYLVGNQAFTSEEPYSKQELNHFSKNYEEAKKYLIERYAHHRTNEITPLLNKRLEKLKELVVNAIYITKPEFAGEVFESINGTGITLKLSELVKNYIFRCASSAKDAQNKWDSIEANCDNKIELVENIIKYDWQNRYEETDDFEIFRSIKKNERDVNDYINRLLRVSKIFSFYLHPNVDNFSCLKIADNRNDKNHIVRFSATLRVINVKQFLRLIIALDSVREFIPIQDYLNLLKRIHNFQVRAKVSNLATNEVDRLYSKYGKKLQRIGDQIDDGTISRKDAQSEIRKIIQGELPKDMVKISSDEAFLLGIQNYSRTKSTASKNFFKEILSRIEGHLQKSELIIDTRDNQITLEEIYPQEPSTGWSSTDLGNEDIYRLGNATILKGKDNGAGSNKTIDEKYPIYEKSNLIINQKLVEMLTNNGIKWDRASISTRAKQLSDIAAEIWKINY